MPELKTHKDAARRFTVTVARKFTRPKGNISHKQDAHVDVSTRASRQIDEMLVVTRPGQGMLRKPMPYAR